MTKGSWQFVEIWCAAVIRWVHDHNWKYERLVTVAGQDRAKAFYTEDLGFEVRSDAEALPGIRIQDYPPMFFFADPNGNGVVFLQR